MLMQHMAASGMGGATFVAITFTDPGAPNL
jgi:hypothetical protein